MAQLTLGALGGAFFGPVGGAIGSFVGAQIDSALFGPSPQSVEGPRQTDFSVQHATPGNPIAQVWGKQRIAGGVIYSSGLIETRHEDSQGGGGKGGPGTGGGGATTDTATYTYHVDMDVLVCKGPIDSIGRIWGDAKIIREANGDSPRVEGGIRIYTGTTTQLPDIMEETAGGGNASGHRGMVHVAFDTFQLEDFGSRPPQLSFEVIERTGKITIIDILTDVLDDSGLAPECYDLTCLQRDPFDGYAIARPITARGVAENLQNLFEFDVTNTAFSLLFRSRNRKIDFEIDKNDLAASDDSDNRPERREKTRKQDLELPKEIDIAFQDFDRDYQTNQMRSRRIRMDSQNVDLRELPIVMGAGDVKNRVDTLAARNHIERHSEQWFLPFKYINLDAGDIVAIKRDDGTLERWRILTMHVGVNGLIELMVVPSQWYWMPMRGLATVSSVAGSSITFTPDTFLYLLNLPLLRDTEPDNPGFYVAMSTDVLADWGGANLFGSEDAIEYFGLFSTSRGAVAGTADTALPPARQTAYRDRESGVRITLINGTLTSITSAQMYGTRNVALLGNEIIRFQTATLVGPATYELRDFKRGVRGTEHQTDSHVAGERFVLLEQSRVTAFQHAQNLVGVERFFKAATFGQSLADVGSPSQETAFTSNAERLRPWSGVCPVITRDGPGNITASWKRRDRRENGWLNKMGLPLNEDSESYEVETSIGSPEARIITASSPSIIYTVAQQVTDFGSTQASVRFDIFQMSATQGRGNVLTITG